PGPSGPYWWRSPATTVRTTSRQHCRPAWITSSPSHATPASSTFCSVVSSARAANRERASSAARPTTQPAQKVPDDQGGPASAAPIGGDTRIDLHPLKTCHRRRLSRQPGAGNHLLRRQTERVGSANPRHGRGIDCISVQCDIDLAVVLLQARQLLRK